MRKVTFHCRCGPCDERSDVFEFEDDTTQEEIEKELVQWVLDQIDHWSEEGDTEER